MTGQKETPLRGAQTAPTEVPASRAQARTKQVQKENYTGSASKRSPAQGLPVRRLEPKQVKRQPFNGLSPLADKHSNRPKRNPAQAPKPPCHAGGLAKGRDGRFGHLRRVSF